MKERCMMTDIGKFLILTGLLLAVAGLLVWGLGRSGFSGLPGDIAIRGRNFRVYFPIVTCVALSLILSAIMWLWQWWREP